MEYLRSPAHTLAGGDDGAREREEPQVLIRIARIKGGALVELRTVEQVHRGRGIGQLRHQHGKDVAVRPRLQLELPETLDLTQLQTGAIDGRIKRCEQPDVVARAVQVPGEGARHVPE